MALIPFGIVVKSFSRCVIQFLYTQGKVSTVLTVVCMQSLQHSVKSLVMQTEGYQCEMVGISHPGVLSN